ncbi:MULTISPECIES: hypothetical protein [Marinobacter]|jgi:hypothetical protein|uniref:hypothetical protein n=1 Tax=Marinobacter TaxID=2742 RepID=UPI0010FE44E4|nr:MULTISPECIES: hypothetical protein [unclassified Marinobacter]
MARIALALSFLLLLSGCTSQSSLVIQPYSELAIEVPEKMFSSVKMRDGELVFLRNNRVVGFVRSEEIPSTVSSSSAIDTSTTLFESANQGSSKPIWMEQIPEAQVFGVVQGDFRTVFIVPNGQAQSLITFQGPAESSTSLRINGAKISE